MENLKSDQLFWCDRLGLEVSLVASMRTRSNVITSYKIYNPMRVFGEYHPYSESSVISDLSCLADSDDRGEKRLQWREGDF